MMQIERTLTGIVTLGPGSRLAVWVNGCHRRCKGCVSESLQAVAPENECEVVSHFDQFDLSGIDGVTISGGEPFDQPDGLYETVKYFVERGIADILVYTGFTLEELNEKNDERIAYILQNIAVLIDGPYVQELDSGIGNLKGSDNQRILFLKPEMKPAYDAFYKEDRKMQEFYIGNWVLAVGIPNQKYIEDFVEKNNERDRIICHKS